MPVVLVVIVVLVPGMDVVFLLLPCPRGAVVTVPPGESVGFAAKDGGQSGRADQREHPPPGDTAEGTNEVIEERIVHVLFVTSDSRLSG